MAGKVPKQLKRRSDTPASALGAVLTELRLARGWGYQYVAHKIGCTPGYMNEMEHGKRNPTLKLLQATADLHGIKLSRLIAMAERSYEHGPGAAIPRRKRDRNLQAIDRKVVRTMFSNEHENGF